MKRVLAQGEITDVFAQIETDVLKENQPRVKDVNARVVTQGPEAAGPRSTTNGRASVSREDRGRARPPILLPDRRQLVPNHVLFAGQPAFRQTRSTCQWAAESLKSAEELASK